MVCYPGCIAGRGFDETGEKGFVSVQIGSEPEPCFVPSSAVRFYELGFFASDYTDENALMHEMEASLNEDGIYRITVSGTELPSSYIEKRLSEKALHVELITEEALPDTPFMKILREELSSSPEALSVAIKALSGREADI